MDTLPVTIPLTGEAEEQAAAEVIRSGWLTQGPKTAEFERRVADYTGAVHAVAASNCTLALMMALEAVGVGQGDEVITSPYSFIATANAIVARGARPVFADIDLATYNLDPNKAAEAVTGRTKALMPVDQLGMPCDLDAFGKLAREHGLAVVQDSACALGSRYKDRAVGAGLGPGHLACISFHPRKLITTGEGGMVTTDDPHLAERCRLLASHGAAVSEEKKHASTHFLPPRFPTHGYNYRLSDILAAVGLAQMDRLDDILSRRRRLAACYDDAFRDHDRIVTSKEPGGILFNYQSYQIRLRDSGVEERGRVVNQLREEGVMVTYGVADIHRQEAFVETLGRQVFPMAELAADTSMILPLFPQMSDDDVRRAAEAVVKAVG